jgi:outer membrane murein-binding lipoprotein Lpp
MEFLKALFGDEALTYDQLLSKVQEGKLNVVNIADGSYISRDKYNDKVNDLSQQVTDLKGQITQRDADMADLNDKLTAAQADAGKLSEAQTALTGLQAKYDTDMQNWEAKLAQQNYEAMVRERANGLQFTSPAAKRDFVREANSKGFKVDGESLLGYDDFVSKYKADNPGALVEPAPADPTPTPTVVLPGNPGGPAHKRSLADLMRAKNENQNLVINFDN